MLKAVRRRHGEAEIFIVYVLWLIGFSERSIGDILYLRPKQVAGIIGKSDYVARTSMTDQERREKLMELQQIRIDEDGKKIDGGRLDKIRWELRPLRTTQMRGPTRRKLK